MKFSYILRPDTLINDLYDREKEWSITESIISVFVLAVESWILIATLQYWWWGLLFFKTGFIFWISLFIILLIPSSFILKKFTSTIIYNSVILIVPVILCVAVNFILYIGWIDPTLHRYLYRCTWLMIFIGCNTLWSIFWKMVSYRNLLQLFLDDRGMKIKIKVGILIFLDGVLLVGFALLLTNIEGVLTPF